MNKYQLLASLMADLSLQVQTELTYYEEDSKQYKHGFALLEQLRDLTLKLNNKTCPNKKELTFISQFIKDKYLSYYKDRKKIEVAYKLINAEVNQT